MRCSGAYCFPTFFLPGGEQGGDPDWVDADQRNFVFNIDGVIHEINLSVMNDDNNLYIKARVDSSESPISWQPAWTTYRFQNQHGESNHGDNYLIKDNFAYNRPYDDRYHDFTTNSIELDTDDGGTEDGAGMFHSIGPNQPECMGCYTGIWQIWYPLCSNDINHDFCVEPGDTLGFWFTFGHGGLEKIWPANVNAADIVIASQDTTIEFDRLEYPLSVNPIITVVDATADKDPTGVDFVSVSVTSSSDLGGIVVTLRETGDNTGIFSGIIILTYTDESSGHRLRVSNCDIIQATYKNSVAEATAGTDCNKGVDVNGKIVFTSNRDGNHEIYIMNADGSGQTRLTDNSFRDGLPCWSPDGTKIVFTSNRDGNDEIYVMNADGSDQTRLTDNSFRDLGPCWSPDGTKIVFSSDEFGTDDIYVMNADGSGQTRLTSTQDDDGFPVWSPDGTKIAFQSDRNGSTDIWVMNVDGSGLKFLTQNPAQDRYPDWSPDGSKIAFQTSRAPNSKSTIYVMNAADGSGQTRLGNEVQDFFPSWSPDGTKIAFGTFRDFTGEIYVMNADGSDQTRLTDNSFRDYDPDWQALEVSSQPNLVVSSMTHLPANPDTDDLIGFTAVVKNIGDAQAPSTTLEFRIGGETPGPSNRFNTPILNPGDTWTKTRQITLNVAQNYMNTAIIDVFNTVAESDETNNKKTLSYQVTQAQTQPTQPTGTIDLSWDDSSFKIISGTMGNTALESPTLGTQQRASVTLTNTGTETASDFYVYLITVDSTGSEQIQSYSHPSSFAPGQTQEYTQFFTISNPGTYEFKHIVDYKNQIVETNENNNISSHFVTFLSPDAPTEPTIIPTLVFTDLRAEDSFGNPLTEATVGEQVVIYADVFNNNSFEVDFVYYITIPEISYESWITSFLTPGRTLSPGLGQAFESPGTYTVRAHLYDNIQSRNELASPLTITIQVGADVSIPPTTPAPVRTNTVIATPGSSVPGCEQTWDCYDPYSVLIRTGDTVTWFNRDNAAHTVTSGTPSPGPDGKFDSSAFMAGTTFQHTFNSPGEFPYFGMIHPWAIGEVIVEGFDEGITIVSVTPADQQGNFVSSFSAGSLSFVSVVVSADSPTPVLVTVNLLDASLTPIGIASFSTTLPAGPSEFQMSFSIPSDAARGTANIYANVFTDWPSQGGTPLTAEKSASVTIP